MKRWFIARMGDYEGDGSRVPATNKYPCNTRIWSHPTKNWCLGQLAIADLTQAQADPDIFIIPDAALDNAVSTIPTQVRNTMLTRLQNAGFETAGIKTVWTIRQVLIYLMQQIQPALNSVEQGDVKDIEQ
jgi:hypothetical protein